MIAKVYSAIPDGYAGCLVEVEGHIANSLPAFNIVGMASKTISEARERVRAAIMSSDLTFPTKKVTVSLAPADLLKTGSHLDLPIALAVLVLSGNLLATDLTGKLFVGELSLDGHLRPVRGIINILETARRHGFTEVFLPLENLPEASLVSGLQCHGVTTLIDLVLHLKGIQSLPPPQSALTVVKNTKTDSITQDAVYLDQVQGQPFAKRALIIALAGHHNLLLSGPPGVGKTFLARTARSLLPPPTPEEWLSIAKIYSLYGQPFDPFQIARPFRSPHHTASPTALIGGSTTPGEISLAHHGILFLDELPEFPRPVLEALRQPLEDRQISITRAHTRTTFPADFMLIATMNPCPCGHLGDPIHPCTCTSAQIQRYQHHLSGPILDRIDLFVSVARAQPALPTSPHPAHPEHTATQSRIASAISRQFARYGRSGVYNASTSLSDLQTLSRASPRATALLKEATTNLHLSARALTRVLKVARTIADLDDSDLLTPAHLSEALSFRQIPSSATI